MPYFQNLFTLADRHHIPKFVCPHNAGRGDEIVVAWNEGPYDLSGTDSDGTNSTDTLEIVFAMNDSKNWATVAVNVAAGAVSSAAVTSEEIVTALNNDATFASWFLAILGPNGEANDTRRVTIRQKKPITNFRFYINNGRAEEVLRFNARAGIAELPSYFSRHTMDNRFLFDDSQNMLIELDATGGVDGAIINNAVNFKGVSLDYTSASVSADWELLRGRSGLFDFTSDDGSSSPNTKIVYPAGAQAGDLAKKIITSGGNTYVIPYTLQSGDLITPP